MRLFCITSRKRYPWYLPAFCNIAKDSRKRIHFHVLEFVVFYIPLGLCPYELPMLHAFCLTIVKLVINLCLIGSCVSSLSDELKRRLSLPVLDKGRQPNRVELHQLSQRIKEKLQPTREELLTPRRAAQVRLRHPVSELPVSLTLKQL